jgi:hypothetical protein
MAAYREDRRRKLLREDVRSSADLAAARSSPGRRATAKRTYSDAARHLNQPRITDLIPQRPFMLFLCWLLGLLVPAALSTAYFLSTGDPAARSEETFRLIAIGSLSRWWSSVMLLGAAAISGMIFHLRRHRLDDYYGRYRVWLAVIMLLILGSADVATNLHDVVHAQMDVRLAGSRFASLQRWWAPVGAGAALICLSRLLWEVWGSRGASLFLVLAATSYTVVGLILGSMWQLPNAQWRELIVFSALHLGHHQLLFALLLYCRHVYRAAQGAPRSAAKKRRKTDVDSNDPGKRDGSLESGSTRTQVGSSTDDSERRDARSSKTELRRQRKELRKQRRAA